MRYADDFLLFLPDARTAQRAMDFTRRRLASLDLELHPDKSRVAHAAESIVFLGQPVCVPKRLRKEQTSGATPATAATRSKWLTLKRLFSSGQSDQCPA